MLVLYQAVNVEGSVQYSWAEVHKLDPREFPLQMWRQAEGLILGQVITFGAYIRYLRHEICCLSIFAQIRSGIYIKHEENKEKMEPITMGGFPRKQTQTEQERMEQSQRDKQHTPNVQLPATLDVEKKEKKKKKKVTKQLKESDDLELGSFNKEVAKMDLSLSANKVREYLKSSDNNMILPLIQNLNFLGHLQQLLDLENIIDDEIEEDYYLLLAYLIFHVVVTEIKHAVKSDTISEEFTIYF